MSTFTDRTNQVIGPYVVEGVHKRDRHGRIVWRLRHPDGTYRHMRTYLVIRLARQYDSPKPS